MTEQNFTLVLIGGAEPHLDALHEAGCDDALFGAVDGVHFAEFDRVAESLKDAIWSAIRDVERTPMRVARVEPDDLVTASEIAERLGRTRESIRLLVSGARGPGDFPAPVSHSRQRNRLWRLSDVLAWAGAASTGAREDAVYVAAVNAALELRARSAQLDESARHEVQRLAQAA